MKGKIELLGMEFHSCHGCLESERLSGNRFVVDFSGELNPDRAASSDSLEDTVDYSLVYQAVSREMAVPSKLLEHVAGRIVKAVHSACPGFARFSIRVSKDCPPVGGKVKESAVTLYFDENED